MNKWSKKNKKCIICGTTEKKHHGNGLCSFCYEKYSRHIKTLVKNCPQCKTDFNPKKKTQTYCNKECWRKSLRKKMIGKNNPMFGVHLIASKETKKKLSKASSGENNPMFGVHLIISKETKAKRIKGWTKEKRQKQSERFIGEKSICFTGGKAASTKRRIEKVKNTLRLRLKQNVSSLIHHRLKFRLSSKNGKSTFSFLPYTIDKLIKHLENQFKPWMDWNNYGMGKDKWNMDHIIPDSSFNYKNVEDKEFQECWALENLQPLSAIKNIKKGNKII